LGKEKSRCAHTCVAKSLLAGAQELEVLRGLGHVIIIQSHVDFSYGGWVVTSIENAILHAICCTASGNGANIRVIEDSPTGFPSMEMSKKTLLTTVPAAPPPPPPPPEEGASPASGRNACEKDRISLGPCQNDEGFALLNISQ
jgi:hypothetical protein